MRLTFKGFRDYLLRSGYTEGEIRHLYGAVWRMDAESRRWVLEWFHSGRLPGKAVEGVTAQELVEKLGYQPLNAFILLDWLKANPQEAKYFAMKLPTGDAPSEAFGRAVEDLAQRQGLAMPPPEGEPDLSDITEEG